MGGKKQERSAWGLLTAASATLATERTLGVDLRAVNALRLVS
jgi:hypothetical protein